MPEFMGKRKCEFCRGAADEVWIPGVASRHRVALMQELNIHRVRAQSDYAKQQDRSLLFQAARRSKAWSYWEIGQLVIRHWPEIKSLTASRSRPFGFVVELNKSKSSKL
jgi:hypothetical protein